MDHKEYGILYPGYKGNPEAKDKPQVLHNLNMFFEAYSKGIPEPTLIWGPSKMVYQLVSEKMCAANIFEVGCGGGFGANILSTGNRVWAVDKNKMSVAFAREAFGWEGLLFDHMDIMDSKTFKKPPFESFHVVASIGVIEHIGDPNLFLNNVIQYGGPDAEYYFSTDNRNRPLGDAPAPQNPFHVREWTVGEFHGYLERFFKSVVMMDNEGNNIPDDSDIDVMVAQCNGPSSVSL